MQIDSSSCGDEAKNADAVNGTIFQRKRQRETVTGRICRWNLRAQEKMGRKKEKRHSIEGPSSQAEWWMDIRCIWICFGRRTTREPFEEFAAAAAAVHVAAAVAASWPQKNWSWMPSICIRIVHGQLRSQWLGLKRPPQQRDPFFFFSFDSSTRRPPSSHIFRHFSFFFSLKK